MSEESTSADETNGSEETDDANRSANDPEDTDGATGGPGVLVFNPLPWERVVSGPIPSSVVDVRGEATDSTASRHFQDRGADFGCGRLLDGDPLDHAGVGGSDFRLPETTVPGTGYAVVARADIREPADRAFDERAVVETERYRIEFDRERGGIARWYDAEHDCEWVDGSAADPLAGFVHEAVADREHDAPRSLLYRYPDDADWIAEIAGLTPTDRAWQSDWRAERARPERVCDHRVYDASNGYEVVQRLAMPAVESDVIVRVFVPTDGPTVRVEAAWEMGVDTHPESTYLAFPFAIEDATARVDVGAQAMQPGADQIAGTCHDYYTAQRWVDLSGDDRGMTVACPRNPMVQFGEFSFADDAREFAMARPQVLGWVTSTYWETNYRAAQPGGVVARYHLTPHGEFDEATAHRRGLEAEHADPVVQTLGEPATSDASLPPRESLLDLPEPPVLVVQVRPDRDGPGVQHVDRTDTPPDTRPDAFLVRLQNASDTHRSATIGSGAVSIASARRVGLLGESIDDGSLSVTDGTVSIDLDSRAGSTIRIVPAQ